ncbi:MAG: alpha-1,4-glucan--maltose-1-phosphate maltosyltransferase [Verrucomicrobiae bacterium]|jgi:starch synthase (maltosyl-transferring)|nr:alpha-1,4-glucan--maltose-1-phosphate maltosyltransferase [Verrucomicrobiae bacterium]
MNFQVFYPNSNFKFQLHLMSSPFPSITIEDLSPSIEGGQFPIKRVPGQSVVIEATIFKEGHDAVRALLKWRAKSSHSKSTETENRNSENRSLWQEIPMKLLENHRFQGSFQVTSVGFTEYTIEAWGDPFDSWLQEVKKKIEAGIEDLHLEAQEGAILIHAAAQRSKDNAEQQELINFAIELEKKSSLYSLKDFLKTERLLFLMHRYPDRSFSTLFEPFQQVRVDRLRAAFGAWYEFFPRSAEGKKESGSNFREALARIDDAKAMGFHVIYFPPIHPIGLTGRKGRNNSLECLPEDPGVPYAIGAVTGGHDSIEPLLGTIEDFQWLIAQVRERNMEVALDFALNCSPDHPYVQQYPEWFYHRPDGSIKYAENPPKKYEDVFPLNFYNTRWKELWKELLGIFLIWAERGVRIFRVDNPHTKPVTFWQWVIAEVQEKYPDVIFLSEAFTHPAMMKKLAKIGFTQSYSYFTWRNTKEELENYFTELTHSEMKEYFRPNLFPNTPDILPFYLQEGGRSAFLIRAALAATLSSIYGIYSGFELCENAALPGKEEYADSEKYQFKERDWNAPGNIKPWITRLNQIRNSNSALQNTHQLQFCHSNNNAIIAYLRSSEDNTNHLLIMVNLDPHQQQAATVEIPLHRLRIPYESPYCVEDLLTGECYEWKGTHNFISLNPLTHPAHIFRVKNL